MTSKPVVILASLIISVLMLFAMADNPYGYYQFLRIATLLLAGYIAYAIYQHAEESKYVWFFIGFAVLFNPFMPIYLDKGTWSVIDLLAAISAPIITAIALRK